MNLYYPVNRLKAIILLLGITTSLLCRESKSNELKFIIKDFCLDEYRREMKEAQKEVNTEIGDFSCNCFIDRIEGGESVTSSLETCKEAVVENFNL